MKAWQYILVPVIPGTIIGIVTFFSKPSAIILVSQGLWFWTGIILSGFMVWVLHHIKHQISDMASEKPPPSKKFPIPFSLVQEIENEVAKLAQKLQDKETEMWGQTMRQANDSLKLVFSSSVDGLTGVANRRYLDTRLQELFCSGVKFTVIMLDIDFFKKVNDTYGHQAGDEVLKQFAKIVSKTIRPEDFLARYGGEEFTVICPTGFENARKVAERIRECVEVTEIQTCAGVVKITSSLGVAEKRQDESLDSLLKRADEYLYQAKKNGRNQVRGDE